MSLDSPRNPLATSNVASLTADRSSTAAKNTQTRNAQTRNAQTRNAKVPAGAFQPSHPINLNGRAVLLATDGSAGDAAATRVAMSLATKYHAVIHVISVIDTRAVPFPPAFDLALAIGVPDSAVVSDQKEVQEVRAALAVATGHPIDWPIHVALGAPATTIADEAQRLGVALVIVGLHRHGRVDRTLNNETALNVMRHASCPVLGVVPGMTELPVRVLAAMDFGDTSLVAARMACAVVGDGAVLVMAYVPPLTALLFDQGEKVIHDLGVHAAFAQASRALDGEGITFDHVVLHHELPRTTAEMLLDYADSAKSDLLVAGSARHGRLERWMIGSVSTDLVQEGRHSVLIVPPLDSQRP